MKTFNIWGTMTIEVDFEIDAKDEAEAREKAIERLNDMYHLEAYGGLIVPKSADHKWYVDDINE